VDELFAMSREMSGHSVDINFGNTGRRRADRKHFEDRSKRGANNNWILSVGPERLRFAGQETKDSSLLSVFPFAAYEQLVRFQEGNALRLFKHSFIQLLCILDLSVPVAADDHLDSFRPDQVDVVRPWMNG
jgi:hypothetical protein